VLDKDEILTLIELALGTCGLFRFNPDKLLAPTYTGEASPALRPDGEGLAEVLINMQLSDADRFAALQDALRAVVPEVERFHLRRVEVMRSKSRVLNIDGNTIPFTEPERVIGHELLFDISGCKNIPARATSEGTLIALGVLTALWTPNRQGLVLIDSLEHSLHPRAQWQLLAQIRSLLGTFPSLQVVATTHSPDLVDRLEPSEVVVMAVDKDGISRAQPLTNCPRSELFDTLSAGEMWSAMGESWVTKEEA
jgi:predicted ATPase